MSTVHFKRRATVRTRQRGVSLMELMIGMLVGLLATLVIAQTLSVAEGQKRTATDGTDAQVNGALALHALSRDVQMAGYGLSTSASGIGCEIRAQRNGVAYNLPLAPAFITNGAGGAADSIQLISSNKAYALPYRISKDHPRTAANIFLDSALGVTVGDLMIAVPATIDADHWCSLFNVTGANGDDESKSHGQGNGLNQVIHNSGVRGVWNQSGGHSIFPADGYPAGSYLLDVGQFVQRTYAISAAKSLTMQTLLWSTLSTTTDELFPQIVQLQAMYGKDTNNDGVVDTWDNTTPATNDNVAWRQVVALRIALVARSQTYEKEAVTTTNPLWDVGAAGTVSGTATSSCHGGSRCISIDVGAAAAGDAQHYRYKVFDSIVPLRNMVWRT